MKKFLSLVLALTMALSLVTVSAGATDFDDDGDITYQEAVTVIAGMGIVDGYSDGSFRPDDVLTRGAAAKIICNLILGPTTADALSASSAPFVDVPTTNTFAGYITYCSQQGIISGYADGTFRPTDTLSGNAFMKMLLGALGYDSDKEGYTGANWTVNVIKQAVGIGLDDGNDNFVGSQAVTREEAALYAFNMLQATMVEYDQQNTIVVGDITINTTSSRKDVANTTSSDGNIDNDDLMQFAERYFTDLKKQSGDTDEFNRPAITWKLSNKSISTYAETPDVTYTSEVKSGTIYSDLGLTMGIAAANITGYRNGSTADFTAAGWNAYNIARGDNNKFGGNGALTEVWYDDDADTVTISVIDTYAGEVSAVYDATSARDAYVYVTAKDGAIAPSGEYETTEFNVDDVVTYNYSKKSGDVGVYNVASAETVTGTMSGYTANKSVTVGGTVYTGDLAYKGQITDAALGSYKTYDVTLVLDPYGYVAYVDTTNASTNYAVVTKIRGNAGDFNDTAKAALLLADGETMEVELTNATAGLIGTGAANKIEAGDIVSFSVNSNGKYDLKLLADWDSQTGTSNTIVKNGQSSINLKANIWNGATHGGTASVANGKTVFLVKTMSGSDSVYTAYTGIANVPDITVSAPVTVTAYCKTGSIATLVYVDATANATVSNSNSDVVFIKSSSAPNASYDATLGTYYVYTAIVNGEIVNDFKATNSSIASNGLYTSVSYDKNGVATLSGQLTDTVYANILAAKGGTATGTVRAEDGVIGLGATFSGTTVTNANYYTYANDVQVFFINSDGDITTSSIGAISNDADDVAYFKLSDGEISTLIVVQNGVGSGPVGGGSNTITSAVLAKGTTNFELTGFTYTGSLPGTAGVIAEIYKSNASEGNALVGKTASAASVGATVDTGVKNTGVPGNYYAVVTIVDTATNAVLATYTTNTYYIA